MKKPILSSSLFAALALAAFASAAAPVTSTANTASATATPMKTAAPKVAEQGAKKIKMSAATGMVVSADAISSTLTIKQKKGEVSYSLEKDAKISRGMAAASLEDLKADSKVRVHFKKEGDKLVASSVEILKGGTAAEVHAAK